MTKKFYTPIRTIRALQAKPMQKKQAAVYLYQSDEENSSTQLAQIEACAAQDGLNIAKVYFDTDSADLGNARSGLIGLLKDASQRQFTVVYIQKVERLPHQVKMALEIVKKLEQTGATLKVAEFNLDLGTFGGKLGFQTLVAAAEICAKNGGKKLAEPKTKEDAKATFQTMEETLDQTTLEGKLLSLFTTAMGTAYVHYFDEINALEA